MSLKFTLEVWCLHTRNLGKYVHHALVTGHRLLWQYQLKALFHPRMVRAVRVMRAGRRGKAGMGAVGGEEGDESGEGGEGAAWGGRGWGG